MTKVTKLSIQRALDQINLLDKRILASTPSRSSLLITSAIGNRAITGYKDDADFANQAKSKLDTVLSLITRRDQIKSAIITANALTTIRVGEETMTIASAIERRSSIKHKKNVLNALRDQYTNETNNYEVAHYKYREKLDAHLETLYGKENRTKHDEDALKPFKEINEPRLIDPLSLKNKIDVLAEEIDVFESEIKFALSEANVRTEIEINE